MPNQHTVAGPMVAVVGTEERPYDRDETGKPITRRWDLLACGHALPSRFIKGQSKRIMALNAGIEAADMYENYETRKCKVCDG